MSSGRVLCLKSILVCKVESRGILTSNRPVCPKYIEYSHNGRKTCAANVAASTRMCCYQDVYGEKVMSREMVGCWCCMFRKRRQIVEDKSQNGHPSTSRDENNITPPDFHLFSALKVTFLGHMECRGGVACATIPFSAGHQILPG
ncbi:hypothetical protein TNCV_4940471 [Trichonephila clavipes]|nr:hypothetical protein TNCV_4940471 [Trichonephila clavipes]